MADRSVKVVLRAEVTDFKRQLASAGTSLEDLAKKGDKTGQVSQTFMGRMVQSAQLQREAWTTAGTALAGFGTAVTGVGIAALATGISYNQLQQTSRAALTTLTGSAEEANAQMDRLDEFASSSPFAKDVFITAQQQMLGFGIEAQKVIPYLDAIQNAVAATGGSNQDISELSRIFSQISASAKITGEDLREFGNRGIDAATIIGSQMGMTGAQIREQITAGTLDAGTALDALAAGMQDRFGGAADNVKNTLSGAFDRVKAAWRDLSSELAAPLVGTEGGGLLTGLLNQTADLMRAFQDLPGPVKTTATVIGGLSGAAGLAAGGFLILAPRIVETQAAFRTLAQSMPEVTRLVGRVGKIAQGAFIGFASWKILTEVNQWMDSTVTSASELENALITLGDVEDPIQSIFGDGNRGMMDGSTGLAMDAYFSDIEGFQQALDDLTSADFWNVLERNMGRLQDGLGGGGMYAAQRDQIQELDAALSNMAANSMEDAYQAFDRLWGAMDYDAGRGAQLLEVLPGFREHLVQMASEMGVAATDANLLRIATGELAAEATEAEASAEALAAEEERLAEVTRLTTEEARDQIDAFSNLYDAMRQIAGEFMGMEEAQRAWGDLLRENSDIMDEFVETQGNALNEAGDGWNTYSEAGSFAIETLHGLADAGLGMVDAMRENGATADELRDSIAEVRQEVIDQATAFGMTEENANSYADSLGLIPDHIETAVYMDSEQAEQDVINLRESIDNMPGGTVRVNGDTQDAETAVDTLMGIVENAEGDVVINGETVPAEEALATALELVNNGVGFINIDGSTEDFDLRVANSVAMASDADPEISIYGNNEKAIEVLAQTISTVDDSVGVADIDANNDMALFQTEQWRRRTDSTTGTAGIDAQDRGARSMLDRTIGTINRSSGSVGVGAQARWGQINSIIAQIQQRAGSAGAAVSIGAINARAAGGEIWGPGTATSDSIPALLSNGEFVVRTAAADHYGRGLLHAINNMSLPKHVPAFASGGSVGVHSAAGPQTVVQRVPVPTHLTVVDADGALVGSMRVAAHGEDRAFDRIKGAWV